MEGDEPGGVWSPYPLRLQLQRVAVCSLLPVVHGMLAVVAPTTDMTANEADPEVAGTLTHLYITQQFETLLDTTRIRHNP